MTDRMDQRVHPRCQQSRIAAEVTKGGSQREVKKTKAKRGEGEIERGYSPDTSLVRGVGALYMGRWFEPQICNRVYKKLCRISTCRN